MQPNRLDPVPSQKETSRRWGKEGFSCDRWMDPPGQEWVNFQHEQDEMLLLIDGKIQLEIDGEPNVTLGPGDEVLIRAGVLHTVRNISGSEAKWLYGYRIKPSPSST